MRARMSEILQDFHESSFSGNKVNEKKKKEKSKKTGINFIPVKKPEFSTKA